MFAMRGLDPIARLFSRSLCLVALASFTAIPGLAQAETCSASTLVLQFTTGRDDLRGGNNNITVEIHFKDNSVQFAKNVNQSQSWAGGSFKSVTVPLQQTVSPA